MSARQKEWARKARATLLEILGGKCAWCESTEQLTFDCKEPMGHTHHCYDTSQRISFYRAVHAAGNLQILCHSCNARKGQLMDFGKPITRLEPGCQLTAHPF